MDETKKMLQAVINGQSALKEELLNKIQDVNLKVEKVNSKVDGLQKEMREGFEKVNTRLDTIGKALASLEDDAPTRDEFDELVNRVNRIETKTSLH